MAGVVLCEPGRLYNALQQHRRLPRLAEPNYLSLLGEDAHGRELCWPRGAQGDAERRSCTRTDHPGLAWGTSGRPVTLAVRRGRPRFRPSHGADSSRVRRLAPRGGQNINWEAFCPHKSWLPLQLHPASSSPLPGPLHPPPLLPAVAVLTGGRELLAIAQSLLISVGVLRGAQSPQEVPRTAPFGQGVGQMGSRMGSLPCVLLRRCWRAQHGAQGSSGAVGISWCCSYLE